MHVAYAQNLFTPTEKKKIIEIIRTIYESLSGFALEFLRPKQSNSVQKFSDEARDARNLRMQLEIPRSQHRDAAGRVRAPATTRMDGGARPCTARCRTLSPSPCKTTLFLFLFQPISFAQSSNALRAGQTVFHSFRTRPVTEFVGNCISFVYSRKQAFVFAREKRRRGVV